MKRLLASLAALLLLLAPEGCGGTEQPKESGETASATRQIFAMDTYMTLTAYGEGSEAAVDAAVEEIQRLDALLSVGDESSEVSVLNATGSGTLSEDTAYLLDYARSLWRSTGGAFDITVYPMMELWGFTTGEYHVPDEMELAETLALVDCGLLAYEDGVLTLGAGQGIDFGGIAKGYTSGLVMDIFESYGVTGGCVSLGGNVQCYGTKPDGSLWRVGIENPDDSSSYLGVLTVSNMAVITSGGYERYFEENGVTYHHIIDPATGYPADSGLTSVTVVSPDGTLADGLSTSLFIMGLEDAVEYWRSSGEDFELVLLTGDGTLYITAGLESSFTSDFDVEIIL